MKLHVLHVLHTHESDYKQLHLLHELHTITCHYMITNLVSFGEARQVHVHPRLESSQRSQ